MAEQSVDRARHDAVVAGWRAHAERHPVKAARQLARIERLFAEEPLPERLAATVEGLRAGLASSERCRRCGRELRNPESVARGIGPECLGR